MNKRKLLNLAKKIEKLDPKTFNMNDWVVYPDSQRYLEDKPMICQTELESGCGTACCIGGWHQVFRGHCLISSGVYNKSGKKRIGYVSEMTQKDLELTDREALVLFYEERWPLRADGYRYQNTPTDAAARIRQLVEKGE